MRVYPRNPAGKDAVFSPGEHQPGDGQQHGRQVIDQRDGGAQDNRDAPFGGQQVGHQPRQGLVVEPGHRVSAQEHLAAGGAVQAGQQRQKVAKELEQKVAVIREKKKEEKRRREFNFSISLFF